MTAFERRDLQFVIGRIHDNRFQQFIGEGWTADTHQAGRYAAHWRRAILAADITDLEPRLTDALLDMTDKLIGSLFAPRGHDLIVSRRVV